MRSSRLCGVLMLGAACELTAQGAHQLEFGGHGSVTRYDYLMGLDDRIGAGVRVGYRFTRLVGLELEGGFAQPRTVTALGFTTVRWTSAACRNCAPRRCAAANRLVARGFGSAQQRRVELRRLP